MMGQRDSPLTRRGISQAERVGRLLAQTVREVGEVRLLASPLGRAWQTAVIVTENLGRTTADIELIDDLKEMTWGDWDGLNAQEIAARDPELWAARIADRWTMPPPGGGETQQNIIDRAAAWLATLRPRERCIAVAHGGIGRAVRCVYAGLSPETMLTMDEPHDAVFRLNNGSVIRLDATG